MKSPRHFLDLDRVGAASLRRILALGVNYKRGIATGRRQPLEGKTLAMIFEKPSTRTRVSFEVAVYELGGRTIVLNREETQLRRGETIADTARVLSRYVDAVLIRTDSPNKLEELAHHANVPVINGLTDRSHPCQIVADIMTFEEKIGRIEGKTVAWFGDGNNVAVSWIHAATLLGFELRLAVPATCRPPQDVVDGALAAGARLVFVEDPLAAAKEAHAVVTDTWVSMGSDRRHESDLRRYQVTDAVMAAARQDAVFMHCLPAHRGDEVVASVIDGPRSAVWDEAENRLHAQKGILTWCLED
jgi:ornithine carbamoyltransferase